MQSNTPKRLYSLERSINIRTAAVRYTVVFRAVRYAVCGPLSALLWRRTRRRCSIYSTIQFEQKKTTKAFMANRRLEQFR